jgi:16S rRNA (adenine1518-N6/adenine1519-N6)-dimethyltransferase
MNKKEVLDLLTENGLSPNKMYGQNFLIQEDISRKIVEAAGIVGSDTVLEIGPGLGELTGMILEKGCALTAVEIDSGLYSLLTKKFSNNKNLTLIHNDFLKMEKSGAFNKVVSNLPYSCASEILFNVSGKYYPELLCVMVQREMAERIISDPGTPEYGAMTVMLSSIYESRIAFHVQPTSFFPRPDVVSSVVIFTKKQLPPLMADQKILFSKLVKSAFWGRRKTLVKACSSSPHLQLDKAILLDALSLLGVNVAVRGEELSSAQFMELAKIIGSQQETHD